MSQQKRVVVVIGATGLQGGSVVEAFLKESSKYHIRGLTRNVDSKKAKDLAQKGVEVVYADLKDFDSLQRALQDAHVIYAMTDFWQEMSFDVEYKQGKSVADIAGDLSQLEHFIWAALPDARAISNGKFTHVYHWQSKAAVTDYIRESKPELWKKTTAILFPNYFENCVTQPRSYLPIRGNGVYVRSFPLGIDTPLPNVSIADTGKLVHHVVEGGKKYASKVIAFYSEAISEGAKLDALGKYHNIPVQYERISEREFRTMLESNMPPITALDFTEQLLIFEECGNIYARSEFIQANQIEGLKLKTWNEFIECENLLAHMESI